MKVSELTDIVDNTSYRYHKQNLGEVEVSGRVLKTPDRDLNLAEEGLASLAKFLKIPANFAVRLPDDMFDDVFNHFLNQSAGSDVILEHESNALTGVYNGKVDTILFKEYAEVVSNVFPADADVSRLLVSDGRIQMDVLSDTGVEPRPGDVTRAGARVVGHVAPAVQAPNVSTWMERLVCSNGMTMEESDGMVTIRGNTVDDILSEMEVAATRVLEGNDHRLEQWRALVDVDVSNVEQLVHRLARENGLSSTIESRVLDRVPEIEGNTLYDVVNLMTSMHAEEGITTAQVHRLQSLAGGAIENGTAHRCPECSHKLG